MRLFLAAAALTLAALAVPVAAAPANDLKRLMDDYYAWALKESPVTATSLGVRSYDDRIEDISLAASDRRAKEAAAFLARLETIPDADLTPLDRANRGILRRTLGGIVEGNRYPQRAMLFTTYYGWHQGFAEMSENLPFRSKQDYQSYLTRIAQYPRLNNAALDITAQAVKGGYVLPCSVLSNYERTISGVIAEDPAKSRFYEPFTRARPIDVSEAEWADMQARARRTITDVLNPAYAKHLAFYRTSYLPHCAQSDSISAQPGGAAYYAFRVRQETTTDLTPAQIHELGLREIARRRARARVVSRGHRPRDRADHGGDGHGGEGGGVPHPRGVHRGAENESGLLRQDAAGAAGGGRSGRKDDRWQAAHPVRPAAALALRHPRHSG